MNYNLPKSVELNGKRYAIRTDYRVILDIFEAMNDPDLTNEDKAVVVLNIFYCDLPPYDTWEQALKEFVLFVNMGEDEPKRARPKLMDWSQDFNYIVAPVSRVIGKDVRGIKYLHWWTFLNAFFEIGECTFSQIVSIRDKKHKGKQLEKWEKEWYREHRELVDFKTAYSEAEQDLLKQWGV